MYFREPESLILIEDEPYSSLICGDISKPLKTVSTNDVVFAFPPFLSCTGSIDLLSTSQIKMITYTDHSLTSRINDMTRNLFRLAPNGTNPGFFRIRFSTFWLGEPKLASLVGSSPAWVSDLAQCVSDWHQRGQICFFLKIRFQYILSR